MTILNVIIHPNKVLKEKALPITNIDASYKKLAEDMLETMYKENGIGLAANQVGLLQRIVVIDLQENDEKNPMVLINPIITNFSEELNECEEGCLSIPEMREKVKRPSEIDVEYQDLAGKKHKIHADGLLATCIQHEIDHLDGILFIDRISNIKRELLLKKYKKARAEAIKENQNT
jgi:peptide deformylase